MTYVDIFKVTEEVKPAPLYSYQTVFTQHSNIWSLPSINGESWMDIFHRNWDITPASIGAYEPPIKPIIPQPEKKNFWEGIKEFFKPIFDGIGKVVGFIKTVVKFVANVASVVSVTKHLFA